MKKSFDCVDMKRKVQSRIYEETRGLSREEQLAYFREASEQFWHDIETLRRKHKPRRLSPRRTRSRAK